VSQPSIEPSIQPSIQAGIEPDTKDWTWVLDEPCPECGYAAAAVARDDLGRLVRDDAVGWSAVLAQPGAAERPDEHTWSPLEYGCHVREVHRIFGERLGLMLDHDEPTFANWDQDVTAVEDRYDLQDPATVAGELVAAAGAVADRYDALLGAPEETWARRGLRDNGSEFTVDSLARYHLHDVLHHSHDVRRGAARATVAAYDANATDYSDATWAMNDEVRAELDWFAGAVGSGRSPTVQDRRLLGGGNAALSWRGAVLEIGSAGGRDAVQLEERGLTVRRTDVTPAFVELMRSRGYAADLLDPLNDELGGPYDGVWASACLLHVDRADLPTVLRKLAAATRPGGALAMSLKEGDGEEWSVHGHVRAPRRFTYWREAPLRAVLADAGWRVEGLTHAVGGTGQTWLVTRAVRF
jgi:2-polyprenyl-3-methyl-5-hydroxy-6-metoxy-1,4-benzoquinol methylase